jgi:hypothetical protein
MPTRIYLVRHGATDLTAEDRFAGSSDVPLSDEGRRQVACLAERLKREKLDAVYASPLRRTMETARTLALPHGLEPIAEPGLREIDYGHWEGLRRSEVESTFQAEYAVWQEDPFASRPWVENPVSMCSTVHCPHCADSRAASPRHGAAGIPQGNQPTADQQPAGLRHAGLSRPPGAKPRSAEHSRLHERGTRPLALVQRRLALRRRIGNPTAPSPARRWP